MRFLLLAIPLLAFALAMTTAKAATRERDIDYYSALYRLAPDDPDKYTPGQRQFDPGYVVMTIGAEQIIINADNALSAALNLPFEEVEGKLYQNMLTRHSEGDWGDLEARDPDWAASQDAALGPTNTEGFYDITGIHNIVGNEVWMKTNIGPSGNVTTFYLPGED